jgi:putative transposase
MASPRLTLGRISTLDSVYLVTVVTSGRMRVFDDSSLVTGVVAEIDRTHQARNATSLAWVVMPEHLHWLLRLDAGTLSAVVGEFKSRSAREINRRRGSAGRVWQAGFHDHQVRNERGVAAAARYVIANPLRRGLVERLEDYAAWWCLGSDRTNPL